MDETRTAHIIEESRSEASASWSLTSPALLRVYTFRPPFVLPLCISWSRFYSPALDLDQFFDDAPRHRHPDLYERLQGSRIRSEAKIIV